MFIKWELKQKNQDEGKRGKYIEHVFLFTVIEENVVFDYASFVQGEQWAGM